MNARQLQTWTEWLKRHPAKRLGAAVAITTAAFCAAAAPHVAAAADNDASSALSTAGARIRDAAITTKAKAALVGTDNLSSGDIHVKTRHGNVVLTGSVPDLQQRTLAVNTVKQVEGVKDVHDQLTIRPK
ncbi:BON domain-containing protein [Burkholderia ubonensis]|uniref:Transporter n=1 Tax=Burkholderia ubonensis TaxID=101571 RepID=A0A119MIG2_9BURK|nr:BON domain-containing protein [Burkholderia ubonensis]KVS41897.1 transporter [Burkholderia ubonensis]KVS44672.1 transporter [Burkholderia ubonensis]KVS76843.1 transporter [Burkholderia ubonensis]KVS90143.1 transporter [Burkholderia ubonensis]KVS91258.1 transporter [Burkholderia ubonensis]